MNIFKKNKMNENKKIEISKEKIRKEKEKISELKKQKRKKRYAKFLNKKWAEKLNSNKKKSEEPSIKSQIFTALYFQFTGALICLIILYILTGGQNFIKIYIELHELINTYNTITTEYYGKVNKKELIDESIKAMTNKVEDNYTNYIDKKNTDEFKETVGGKYEGIGATVTTNENNQIIVFGIFDNSPAKKAGLKEKDIIIKINDEDYTKKTSIDMANYIKNCKEKKVKLTIVRNNVEKDIIITRDIIDMPTVKGKVIEYENKKIGYISISLFSGVTTNQFKNELKKIEKKGIEALIIDVRNNNGGYLKSVTEISSIFLEKGQIIYQLQNNKNKEIIKDKTKEKRTYPIAVLINKSSASASEILASAIKESYKGSVVGVNSYGKGSVQKTKKLSNGSMIKYTVQKWLTPKGNWINKKGVTPTNIIELDLKTNDDEQLESAKKILTEKINEHK